MLRLLKWIHSRGFPGETGRCRRAVPVIAQFPQSAAQAEAATFGQTFSAEFQVSTWYLMIPYSGQLMKTSSQVPQNNQWRTNPNISPKEYSRYARHRK